MGPETQNFRKRKTVKRNSIWADVVYTLSLKKFCITNTEKSIEAKSRLQDLFSVKFIYYFKGRNFRVFEPNSLKFMPDQISDLIVLLDQRHNEKLEKEERRIPKVKCIASNLPRKELTYNNN